MKHRNNSIFSQVKELQNLCLLQIMLFHLVNKEIQRSGKDDKKHIFSVIDLQNFFRYFVQKNTFFIAQFLEHCAGDWRLHPPRKFIAKVWRRCWALKFKHGCCLALRSLHLKSTIKHLTKAFFGQLCPHSVYYTNSKT